MSRVLWLNIIKNDFIDRPVRQAWKALRMGVLGVLALKGERCGTFLAKL
jgi:hypothetical protein